MSEKIDLGKLERELHQCKGAYFETEDIAEVLALVRAVRVAIKVRAVDMGAEYEMPDDIIAAYNELDAALAPFTDSAEVRSDGE